MYVLILSLLFFVFFSKEIYLLSDPFIKSTRSFWLQESKGSRSLYGLVGISNVNEWKISQWAIPEDLSPHGMNVEQCSCDNPENTTYNSYARVCVCRDSSNERTIYELAMSGVNITCGSFGLDYEFDLFVSPKDNFLVKSPYLSQISSLMFSTDIQIDMVDINSYECGPDCGGHNHVTYSSLLASVILHNDNTDQVLFFQVIVYDSRRGHGCDIVDPCTNSKPRWFYQVGDKNFGASVPIASLKEGGKYLPCINYFKTNYQYAFDLKETIVDYLFPSAPQELDKDLSHWKVGSLYVGWMMEGKATTVANVGNINLVAVE